MEAARSDFTPLARRLPGRAPGPGVRGRGRGGGAGLLPGPGGAPASAASSTRSWCTASRSGGRPRTTARRRPQVRAARLLGWKGERGRVSYVMTRAGAGAARRRARARRSTTRTTSSASSCPSRAPSPTPGAGTPARGSAGYPSSGWRSRGQDRVFRSGGVRLASRVGGLEGGERRARLLDPAQRRIRPRSTSSRRAAKSWGTR